MQVRGDATCFYLLCQHRRPAGRQGGHCHDDKKKADHRSSRNEIRKARACPETKNDLPDGFRSRFRCGQSRGMSRARLTEEPSGVTTRASGLEVRRPAPSATDRRERRFGQELPGDHQPASPINRQPRHDDSPEDNERVRLCPPTSSICSTASSAGRFRRARDGHRVKTLISCGGGMVFRGTCAGWRIVPPTCCS